MNDCNSVRTPGVGKELKSQPDGIEPLGEQATELYHAMVGSLIFLTQCTKFDIAFVQCNLGTWPNPRQCIWLEAR